MIASHKMDQVKAPRKENGVRPAHDPIHVAASFTYRRLCSEKKLARAWRVNRATASRYRTGSTISSLTRVCWEVYQLEASGIRAAAHVARLVLAVARLARSAIPARAS
jgi:hypothetical protein